MLAAMLCQISRWTFTFQLCSLGLRKPASTLFGASPAGPATARALLMLIAPWYTRLVTSGGLEAVGVTRFVTG